MIENANQGLQSRIYTWLMRRTMNSAIRRVGDLPLVIGSDIGAVRKENQDRIAVLRVQDSKDQSSIVAVLCDGMGGMSEGNACACHAISSFLSACIQAKNIPLNERAAFAAQEANKAVHALFQARGGATLSAILYDSTVGMVAVNVGDSRIYTYQDGQLNQITTDDTIAGLLKGENFNRNELLQFIGVGDGLEPHIIGLPKSYELIIMTSDGIHFIDKSFMQMVFHTAKDPALSVKRLIEISKWCGGSDNASIVAISSFPEPMSAIYDAATIQIWDPFGELQIVIPESPEFWRNNSNLISSAAPVLQELSHEEKKSPRPVKKQKATRRKKAAKESPKKENKDGENKKQQLKIYFNGNSGKENHD